MYRFRDAPSTVPRMYLTQGSTLKEMVVQGANIFAANVKYIGLEKEYTASDMPGSQSLLSQMGTKGSTE